MAAAETGLGSAKVQGASAAVRKASDPCAGSLRVVGLGGFVVLEGVGVAVSVAKGTAVRLVGQNGWRPSANRRWIDL